MKIVKMVLQHSVLVNAPLATTFVSQGTQNMLMVSYVIHKL